MCIELLNGFRCRIVRLIFLFLNDVECQALSSTMFVNSLWAPFAGASGVHFLNKKKKNHLPSLFAPNVKLGGRILLNDWEKEKKRHKIRILECSHYRRRWRWNVWSRALAFDTQKITTASRYRTNTKKNLEDYPNDTFDRVTTHPTVVKRKKKFHFFLLFLNFNVLILCWFSERRLRPDEDRIIIANCMCWNATTFSIFLLGWRR